MFFQQCSQLEEGNFILDKQLSQNKLNVMKSAVSNTQQYDLHSMYKNFPQNADNSPECIKESDWVPLDYEIYQPYHIKLNRVPGLFEPVHAANKSNNQNEQKQGGRSGGGKKKKKKPRANKNKNQ
jgi:hypothetical protein